MVGRWVPVRIMDNEEVVEGSRRDGGHKRQVDYRSGRCTLSGTLGGYSRGVKIS